MSDPRLAELLRMLDPEPGYRLWHGGASPLGCLRGVSADAAAWKPAPDRHSIWELVLHIAYWKYAVRRKIDGSPRGGFPRSPANWPRPPKRADEPAWREDRGLYRSEHERFVQAVRALDPGTIDDRARGGASSYVELLHGIVMHDTYHVGQIQLLKRLYRDVGNLGGIPGLGSTGRLRQV